MQESTAGQTFLSTSQVGEALGKRTKWVRERIHTGELPAIRLGREWLVPRRTLADLEHAATTRTLATQGAR